MTRLVENDICNILDQLECHDQELRQKTGGGLLDIAAFAAGVSKQTVETAKDRQRIGIVPITSGQGLIPRFSETIRGILRFLGVSAFVTRETDVAGMAEAAAAGATSVFMADDATCSLIDLRTGRVSDNSLCTGRGFAAALAMRAGSLQGRVVGVLGAGPVGFGAVRALTDFGAEVVIYDCNAEKLERFYGMPHVCCAGTAQEALQAGEFYFEATTSRNTICLSDFSASTLVAAPGVPLGVETQAMERYGDRVLHDALEIGVAAMVVNILCV